MRLPPHLMLRAVLAVCLVLGLIPQSAASAGETVRIVVLHTNDIHGQLSPLPPSPVRSVLRNKRAGGFAYLASMVRAARREAPYLLLLDAGDLFQGTPVGNETRGDAVIDVMNLLAYDAAAVGNHEFDYGVDNLVRLVERAKFPLLAANMSAIPGVKPYVVLGPPRLPCKFAIIGLITPQTPATTTPDLRGKVTFSDPAASLRGLLREIDAHVYLVVSHLGVRKDLELAKQFPGLALIVSGHSHTPINRRVGGTLVMQTHARGISLGRVNLDIDRKTFHVVASTGKLLPVDPESAPKDEQVAALIEQHGRALREKLGEVVGKLLAPARRKGGLGSSTAGNWISDVIRTTGQADVGIMNKGGIRADLEAGNVTAGDIYRLMPFDNTIVAMTLTGQQLRGIIGRHFAQGGYPALEWSGMVITRGETITIEVGGTPLDDKATYRVATNSFLARGGDGFGRFKAGKNQATTGILLRDALAADLRRRGMFLPSAEERLLTPAAPKR